MNERIKEFCPDFYDWPMRWYGVKEDIRVGEQVLECFEPFVAELLGSKLADKTKKRHLGNLWLLGGEIVREVSFDGSYGEDIMRITRESVDDEGGPMCRHLITDEDYRSFNSTCRKLAKYFASSIG